MKYWISSSDVHFYTPFNFPLPVDNKMSFMRFTELRKKKLSRKEIPLILIQFGGKKRSSVCDGLVIRNGTFSDKLLHNWCNVN